MGPRQCGKTTLAHDFIKTYQQPISFFDLEYPDHLDQLQDPKTTLTPLSCLNYHWWNSTKTWIISLLTRSIWLFGQKVFNFGQCFRHLITTGFRNINRAHRLPWADAPVVTKSMTSAIETVKLECLYIITWYYHLILSLAQIIFIKKTIKSSPLGLKKLMRLSWIDWS